MRIVRTWRGVIHCEDPARSTEYPKAVHYPGDDHLPSERDTTASPYPPAV